MRRVSSFGPDAELLAREEMRREIAADLQTQSSADARS